MRALALWAALGLSACATQLGSDNGDLGPPGKVPLVHRPTAEACAPDRPAAGCSSGSACRADSDCTAGNNGRCSGSRGGCVCTYDLCFTDAACGPGTLCSCRGTLGDRPAGINQCLPSNCNIDADCGAGGYCSPSLDPDCGSYFGVTAWHCHTASDTCVNDSDCTATGAIKPFCGYAPSLGHWTCLMAQCVG